MRLRLRFYKLNSGAIQFFIIIIIIIILFVQKPKMQQYKLNTWTLNKTHQPHARSYCGLFKKEYGVMYAIWHIRPHSLFAGPSLSLTLWPPNLSLDGPTYLPAAFAASLLYLCDLFTLAEIRAPAPDRRRIHSLFRRDTGDTEWLESDSCLLYTSDAADE